MSLNAQELLNSVPDPEWVREQLARNNELLRGVIQRIQETVYNHLAENVERLQRVEKRIRSSVNGHLRRNNSLLRPIIVKLKESVNAALAENQASLRMISMQPAVREWMSRTGYRPAWDELVPQPPEPGAFQGAEEIQPAEGGGFRPKSNLVPYSLWYHCKLQRAIGVPHQAPNDVVTLEAQGWKAFMDPPIFWGRNEAELTAYLTSQRERILSLCAAG